MITQQQAEPINNAYAPLFDHMAQDHSVILTISEMDEIISASNKVQENIKMLTDNSYCEEQANGRQLCSVQCLKCQNHE